MIKFLLMTIILIVLLVDNQSQLNCTHYSISTHIDNNPIDLSWIEYIHEVYGTINDQSSILYEKKNILFFYNNAKVKIKLIDEFPTKHLTYLSTQANSYRTAFNSNAKLESNQWVEVSRFSTHLFNRNWYEGYSTGNSYIPNSVNVAKVPYGCWFYPSPGSGIFVQVGKLLFINNTQDAWKNEFKNTGILQNGCVLGDTSIYCGDKYHCIAALSLGYDSYYNIEEQKSGSKYRYPQLIVCRDSCKTVTYNGACPPIELKTYNSDVNNYYNEHNNNISTTITTTNTTSIKYDNESVLLLPCICSEESPMLNCGKRFQFISNNYYNNLNHKWNSYQHTTCVSYQAINDMNKLSPKSFQFQIITSYNNDLKIDKLRDLHPYITMIVLIDKTKLLLNIKKIDYGKVTKQSSVSSYQRLDFNNEHLGSVSFNNYNNDLFTEIKLDKNIIDLIKVNLFNEELNNIFQVGMIVYNEYNHLKILESFNISSLNINHIERQLIDGAMCLHTAGVSLVILIIIPPLHYKTSLKEIITLAHNLKRYVHVIIAKVEQNQELCDNSLYLEKNNIIINLNYDQYSLATIVKANASTTMYITNNLYKKI